MKKISSRDIKASFDLRLSAINLFHENGQVSLLAASDKSTLSEQSLLAVAVLWEGFISELLVSYINQRPERFKIHLGDALNAHLEDSAKAKQIFERYGFLRIPEHLKKSEIESIIDNKGFNITFNNYLALEERAKVWLEEKHANRIKNLTSRQKAVVNAVIAMRNHIAHRSQASSERMNEMLSAGALYPAGLKRGKNKVIAVGAWLRAKPQNRLPTRFALLISEISTIATVI